MSSIKHIEGDRPTASIGVILLLASMLLLSASQLSMPSQPNPYHEEPSSVTALSGPDDNVTVTFHMHWDGTLVSGDNDDLMDTFGPYSPGVIDYDDDGEWGVSISKQKPKNYHYFVVGSPTTDVLHLSGNSSFSFWARSKVNNTAMDITTTLYNSTDSILDIGDSVIATTSMVGQPFLSDERLYTMEFPSIDYIIPADHYLIVSLARDDNTNVLLLVAFDQSFLDTTLEVTVVPQLDFTEYWSEGGDGIARTEFSDTETITVFANISNSLGAYDIHNASLSVVNISDSSEVFFSEMTLADSDPGPNAYWKLFTETFGSIPEGNYSINVSALDNSGNSFWINWTIEVISLHHFVVTASTSRSEAGIDFNITIEAMDSGDELLRNWSGLIAIEAIDNDTGLPISGLANASVFMLSTDDGSVNVTENFTVAPKTIVIRASNGTASGETAPIDIVPGVIINITIDPSPVTMMAGETLTLTATAIDGFDNENDTWEPYWYMLPPNGTLSPYGYSVDLTAINEGFAILYCRDNASGVFGTTDLTIIESPLARIVVTPANNTIWEGKSTTITAVGYDEYDNPVDITGAIWSSIGFSISSLTGSGSSGIFMAGSIPENGYVNVSLGGVYGLATIYVIVPPFGPSLGAMPNQVGYEDETWTADLAGYWTDVNGTAGLTWFVTGVDDSLLIISHDYHSASKVNFIPQPNAYGVDYVTFWVRDSDGYTNFKEISVNIRPINDPPTFIHNPPTELYVKFDLPYTFDYAYYINDVDNPPAQLMLQTDQSDYISSNGLTLTYNFPDLYSGEPYFLLVTLTVSDGSLSDSLNIKVWATTDTPPSLVTPLPDVTINEGDIDYLAFDLDDYFTDADGDVLYYSEGFEYVEITIVLDTNEVLISSPSEWSGMTTAVFVAHDPVGAIRTDTINITVIPVNDAPAIAEIRKIHIHYDVETWLDLRLYVNDVDNGLEELTIYTDDPINASYSVIPYPHLVLLFPANPGGGGYTGPYEVSLMLTVRDPGGLTTMRGFTVRVSDNYPPALTRDPPEFISFLEDEYLDEPYSINLQVLFSDDDDDELSFSCSGNSSIHVVIGSDGWVNFSADANWYGNESMLFTATDPHGAWASFSLRVDVIAVNDPPHIEGIPDIDHYGGRQWSVSIAQYISDLDDPDLAGIEIVIIQPAFVTAVDLVLYFSFPEDVDRTTVILYVTDGDSNSNIVEFTVEIKRDIAEIIGYPWSLLAVLLIAGIIGYLISPRILPHKLQELFIIHNDGRLIYYTGSEVENGLDQDVVSAMFTAVQEFIRDSFRGEPGQLRMLEIGDRKVVIEKGEWIYAALIYSGWPSNSLFRTLKRFVSDIEERYGEDIRQWDGTLRQLPGIQSLGQMMINEKYRPSENNHRTIGQLTKRDAPHIDRQRTPEDPELKK